MATFVNALGQVVSSNVLGPSDCAVGDVLVDATAGTASIIAQSVTTGAPVAVPLGGGIGGGGWSFVFGPLLVQDAARNTYSVWADLCAALAALPVGASSLVTFVDSAVVPPGVWNVNGATFASVTFATGSIVLTVADGGVLDNLRAIERGLLVRFFHTGAGSALTFSLTPPGGPRILAVGLGAALTNDGTAPLIRMSGDGSAVVIASFVAAFAVAPTAAPFVEGGGPLDQVIGAQLSVSSAFSSLPDGWAVGNGNLQYQNALAGVIPLTPGWTGAVLPTIQATAPSAFITYAPAVPADWSGLVPATVGEALDRIAAAIGPIP